MRSGPVGAKNREVTSKSQRHQALAASGGAFLGIFSAVPDIPADLQSALAARYELRRELGRGGMATVYLAYDDKHRREVALKVLRPDLAASLGVERFLKEIQIAARLTHPHILALHDSGEARGFLYYVMPFIEGGSLRQRLHQERRLDPARALAIAAPVADALTYAHRMGVLHRDIKPENILFSQGHPIVADFGIAKAISTAGGANLTRTGFPLGTPGYMSPEQAAGLTDLDERTDVYSLAVVIYEMVVGEIPGRWPTEDAVRQGRFLEVPAGHRLRLAEAGERVEGALARGVAVRHDQRTGSPTRLIEELNGAAGGGVRRRYDEHEIREIVKHASELEAATPTASGALTIGGVEALAGEVGIPREAVRAAVKKLEPPPASPAFAQLPKNPWTGGPTQLRFERVVECEVSDGDFPMLVEEIRRGVRNVGQVSQLGHSFSWVAGRRGGDAGSRDLEVAVSVRGGRTRIVIQEHLGALIGSVFGGIGGGMGGGGMGPILGIGIGALSASATVLVVLIPLWLGTTYAIARTAYHYSTQKRARELERLIDRLAALAEELGDPAARPKVIPM
jgi:serine/threonine protein kinase